jgi:16S rRNA (cytosine967-C5)-methyltransferase
LRRYGREENTVKQKVMTTDEAKLNHPKWLIELITADWPNYPEIFENNNKQPPMTLRVNTSKITREKYLSKLGDENIEARAGAFAQSAVILKKAMPVEALPGFGDGEVSVQDEAPQLVPELMNLEPGLSVIDACAAPGGKTCHLLESEPEIKLTSIDRDRKRIHLITENLERLSLKADVVTQSFEQYTSETESDRILVDAPCSATGIIRRHPDIKLLRTKSDIDKLASVQRGLLNKAFDLLTNGGELLYSTCSILRQENDRVIADFIEGDATKQLIRLNHPGCIDGATLIATEYGLQFLPTAQEHDGFYFAGIRKVAT